MIPQSFNEAFERVKHLAHVFQKNEKQYLLTSYSEAQARLDFIDKFWIALGWDVNHETQTNPYEQEVKVERGVKMSAGHKRADYAFLASNFRDVRFYVEAKKPQADIDTHENYFQVIRYGWNSQTPLAVLMDFEQFRIIDCRFKPDIDTALNRAVKKFHYTDYADEEKFREIYFLFSRAAVNNNSLENFAATMPKPTGKAKQKALFATGKFQSIDDSFLAELDQYREDLARSFKNKNPQLTSEDLTEATQRTLDRLVFIRFLEDKLIEPETIVEKLNDKGSAWSDFVAVSQKLNAVYNGIIFKPHKIIDSPNFQVDEKLFANICDELSSQTSPYDFNSIPIHILGSIYERFLGKVIVATDKRARVEEKPEVRKAGGVYYTPEYVVRYIVENTIGNLIEKKTPEQIAEMRFADIACGSGSFLLGVYDYLIRYHTAYYNEKRNRNKALKAGCIEHEDGTLHLSLRQKKDILLSNIYGVDLDAQAVEVAQLSLFLKLLEEETISTRRQLEFRETMLPPLDKNIICGNSLIEWDILDGQLFDTGEERKLNPMSYEIKFPKIMKSGGFNAIVGNPPYLYSAGKNLPDYYIRKYKLAQYQTDFYVYFIERALQLTKPMGKLSFIVSDSWLNSDHFSKLRNHILSSHKIDLLAVFDYPVFHKVTLENSIFVITSSGEPEVFQIEKFSAPQQRETINEIKPEDALNLGIIKPFTTSQSELILESIERDTLPLQEFLLLNRGIHAYRTDGYGISKYSKGFQTKKDKDNRSYHDESPLDKTYLPELKGKDVDRFTFTPTGDYLSYGIWLAEPREPKFFYNPKIVLRKILGRKLHGTLIEEPYAIDQSLYIGISEENDINLLKFILGVLLSRIGAWYLRTKHSIYDTLYPWYTKKQLAQFPMKKNDSRIVQLVEQMLEAKKRLANATNERDQSFYENKCAALDRQIDALVYELYGLTDEEIAIIEAD